MIVEGIVIEAHLAGDDDCHFDVEGDSLEEAVNNFSLINHLDSKDLFETI